MRVKFKAAVLRELDNNPVTQDVWLDDNLKEGQVLVDIEVSGICGAQLHEIGGHKGNAKFLPHLMGHEGCGTVIKVGHGVKTVAPGDKVVMHWRKGSGIESDFPEYIIDGHRKTSGKINTLQEKAIVSENRLTKVPSDANPWLCALLGCSMTTAMGVINNDAKLLPGETVLILGTGGLGMNIVQAASLSSAGEIICVDRIIEKTERAGRLGANCLYTDIAEIGQRKFDVIVDTTGNTSLISQSIQHLADGGRYVFVGQPTPGAGIVIPNGSSLWSPNGCSFIVSQGGNSSPEHDIERYIRLHEAGLIDVYSIVSNVFLLDDIDEAFETFKSGLAGRIMVQMK